MRLNSLYINNFKCLQDFTIEQLGNVNLIVGQNNIGKTTILEAIRLYATNPRGGLRNLIAKISEEHDEFLYEEDPEYNRRYRAINFESLFYNRCFPESNEDSIEIGSVRNGQDSLIIKEAFQRVYVKADEPDTIVKEIIEKEEIDNIIDDAVEQNILATKNGKSVILNVVERLLPMRHRLSTISHFDDIPCKYIPTQLLHQNDLANEWDDIVITSYEEKILNAIKILENNLEQIAAIKNHRDDRTFKLKTKQSENIPLASMGDGVFRILQLAIKAVKAQDGFLLVDEFENGLHYKTQYKVWKWLFELSQELNIQIFATTHSWDTIESFSKAAHDNTNVQGSLFRIAKSLKEADNNKIIATTFNEDSLKTITQQQVDVR